MDKKCLFTMAVAAAVFAACSDDAKDSLIGAPEIAKTPSTEVTPAVETPVLFGAYVNRATTRMGVAGELVAGEWDGAKWTGVADAGFGVFGYYTDNNDYDPQSAPNFFYNQKVSRTNGTGGALDGTEDWFYDPMKYWPNEYGNNAISDDNDKVSFFAYAPYVEVIPSTGKVEKVNADDDKWGIVGMSRNSATGDPLIKYIASFDEDKSVDLLWGTVGTANTQWDIVNTPSTAQTMTAGLPWLNVQRPNQIDQKLTFDFKHALAQLSVNVDAFVDGTDNTNALNAKTKIFIRSISFTGFAMKGSLNLNNTETGAGKAYWLDYNGTADLESGEAVIIYDGRKDGKEGASGSIANNEKVLGLNPQFVETEASFNYAVNPTEWAAGSVGVTKTPASLFRKLTTGVYGPSTSPIMIIPTGEDMEVEIVYDVETIDPQLANYVSDSRTPGSSVENRIKKTVVFGGDGKMENGKHYTINLHLGMNSVKLDATVDPWVEAPSKAEVDLPLNVPAFAAANPATSPVNVTIPATQTKYEFAITGLNGGESVTAPVVAAPYSAATSNAANSSGIAIESVTIAPNTSIKEQAGVAYIWTGAASSNAVELTFIQSAHALGLSVTAPTAGTSIQLASAASINTDGWLAADKTSVAGSIAVKKNGTALTKNATPGVAEFSFDEGTGEITLGLASVSGDVFEITLKAGDAPAETITVAIP